MCRARYGLYFSTGSSSGSSSQFSPVEKLVGGTREDAPASASSQNGGTRLWPNCGSSGSIGEPKRRVPGGSGLESSSCGVIKVFQPVRRRLAEKARNRTSKRIRQATLLVPNHRRSFKS